METWCSRCPDPPDPQGSRGSTGLKDLQGRTESQVIQERMEKLVPRGKVLQEIQERLALKAKRVMLERVSQGPEAPRDHQDFLEPALGTTQPFLTWRAQDSQTRTKSGVDVAFQVCQGPPAPLGLQWHWDPTAR